MNEEKKVSRKDWVKNAAIVFLAVMLVLTFFSNTFMNYSLPEVATAVVEPGQVTAKIRGTGTLVADDPYKVTVKESRVIASVAVKVGDVVEKDQVLVYLEDKESEELAKAEAELEKLLLDYSTALLAGEVSHQSYINIENGNVSSSAAYQTRITEAKQKVADAQATVDSLTRQLAIAGTTNSGIADKEAALKNAQSAQTQADQSLTAASERLEAAKQAVGSNTETSLQTSVNMAVAEEGIKKTALDVAETDFFTLIDGTNGATRAANDEYAKKMVSEKSTYMGTLSSEIESMQEPDKDSGVAKEDGSSGNYTNKELAVKRLEELQAAYKEYLDAQAARQTAEQDLNNYHNLKHELNVATTEYNNAKNHYDECTALVQSLTNEVNTNSANRDKQKADLEVAKINAEAALKAAEDELKQLLTDVSKELNLTSQSEMIEKKQEEVDELREKAEGATIVAPVAGTITSISKTAGETTVPEDALIVMQPEGKGYSMSFSVTNEQAGKVSVGDVAELQNSWYYENVTATLTGIRPDTENPGQKKLLQFSVTGDVQAGQSISVSVGQRSGSYDMIVPNSSVREDNNGKFILIVESKSSPLGNRYVATRVEVEVLASDDLNTAINAPLYGYEYVITTATKPVEAGELVRLAEN